MGGRPADGPGLAPDRRPHRVRAPGPLVARTDLAEPRPGRGRPSGPRPGRIAALRPALRLARLRRAAADRRHPDRPGRPRAHQPPADHARCRRDERRPTARPSEPPVRRPGAGAGARTGRGRRRAEPRPPRSSAPRPTSSRARARSPSSTGPPRSTAAGPLQRFVVEVEDGIGVDGAAFAAAVETTLGDPRSWGSGGRMSFQRVGAAEAADRPVRLQGQPGQPRQHGDVLPGRRHRRLHLLPLRRARRHQPRPLGHRRPALRRRHRDLPPLRRQPRGRARAGQRPRGLPRARARSPRSCCSRRSGSRAASRTPGPIP